ncbi:hypothetical protein [Halorussus aquaticus]|uniref:Uncharacterized protein n=1 Tax=Halorussus aquaticus TaxID=2953748 RepID=A0ABD5PYD8_9EURY|nr:hypothetical protein [Halorussus aquaticus]
MNSRLSPPEAASFVGLGLLAVGSYLPWVRTNAAGPVPAVYLPGMNTGLDLWGLVIVPLAVAAVALLWRPSRRASRVATAAAGGVACLLALVELSAYPRLDASPFAPAVGVYVTLAGGVVALAASGWSALAFER